MSMDGTLAASAALPSRLDCCNFCVLASLVGAECDCWLTQYRVMWRAQPGEPHGSLFKEMNITKCAVFNFVTETGENCTA